MHHHLILLLARALHRHQNYFIRNTSVYYSSNVWWEAHASKKWHDDTIIEILGHSRFYANKEGIGLSKLFYADKLAASLYPTWLYLLLASLSGEIKEYMNLCNSKDGKYEHYKGSSKIKWWLTTRSKMCLMGLGELGDSSRDIAESLGEKVANG